MSPIKDFNLIYGALNKENTVSQGDTIAGSVTFTLTKETKVKKLVVKAKGEARVHWSEGSGDRRRSYNAYRRYLKLKEFLVAENDKGTVLPKGDHHFKFQFTIPQGDMPSSLKAIHGNIVYKLEAKMSRSWRMSSGVAKELNFVSKSFSPPGQVMVGSVDKKMSGFSEGQVQMSATVNPSVCSPGDTVSAVAKICNSSSKQMRPKFSLQQKIVYIASTSRKISDLSLCKMVGETIAPNSEQTVSCQLTVPADAIHTLQNCEILSVEHYVKVYLDISFAIDPKVVFPLLIVPSGVAALQPAGAVGPYPAGAFGAPSYSDFPTPAFPTGPYPVPAGSGAYGYPAPVPAGSGAYGYPAPDPTQHYIPSGYNNPWPQPAAPYGFPMAASSSVQPPAPTAPPLFQQGGQPPSYVSLYSPPQI